MDSGNTYNIVLTAGHLESLIDFIEFNFFEAIRNDTDIDVMEWACNICDIYKLAKKSFEIEQNTKKEG